ncbi:glycerate dehydrogenase [Pseudobutyrivibrio sp. NOR37]|uniref:D-2-hydroxyacid dehydrogenase n=1 Tax=Pseudobutyrivibrio xylanivorans TaxID=185007 RepID=A0A6M0LJ47_PSEXY|nr:MULTISPECIES: D-2-hydroxyacid dehydrogenase [Pseudobutyrivibrio]NEX01999.1 D-2-hydroxyacid dehydrogenase [Pseudobutyrivibrio xylanivorans]SCY10443.1 glycerate dehydrogenase [Pseudobutyrivibrio sp. AR14]SFR73426.1 glycerate dehydrogenase [Pseudobutyrivibrio sp. NOR37]
MKIVFLDRKTIGEDIDLSGFERFGEVVIYDYSTSEEVPERVKDADIIVLNKVLVNESTIGQAKSLKLVCVTATGTNNLDKDYLASRGIEWRNVAGYSTEAVAQHTLALALHLYEHLSYYDEYVKSERYVNDRMFTHFEKHFNEISGKTWGIIGLGAIGSRVAEIATCLGANVVYFSTTGRNHSDIYKEVDFDTLLSTSDIITIHAPLDENTLHLIDKTALEKMKNTAILVNVGRGPIIVEKDLADALECGQIAAAGLDVLDVEPMSSDNPLVRIKDSTKLIITPHIAWAAVEARQRLMKIIEGQIEDIISSK